MLMISDLTENQTLDRKALTAIRGGMLPTVPGFSTSTFDFSFGAVQDISQLQSVLVNTGNNVAFSSGISATVTPTQNAQNNIGGFPV